MKTIITLFFISLSIPAFSQLRVNGVELPEDINTIEVRLLKYKSLKVHVLAIDYGQEGRILNDYVVTDENRTMLTFNGWIQAVNYIGQYGFKLFAFTNGNDRLFKIDASNSKYFVMVRDN